MKNSALLFIACALLLSCASGKTAPPSALHKQAITLNNSAAKAAQAGDTSSALELYVQALRLCQSIDDEDCTALNLINVASLYRSMDKPADANVALEMVLQDSRFPAARVAQGAALRARMMLDNADASGALAWAQRGIAACPSDDNATLAALYNMAALAHLQAGDAINSIANAQTALAYARQADLVREEANSLRILAEESFYSTNYPLALEYFSQALQIDKSLGLAQKVTVDLMGLAAASLGLGNKPSALSYFKRARETASAQDDHQLVKTIDALMEEFSK